jgi:hypothetical protein
MDKTRVSHNSKIKNVGACCSHDRESWSYLEKLALKGRKKFKD